MLTHRYKSSALEVFLKNDMRYINSRFTYLLTYLKYNRLDDNFKNSFLVLSEKVPTLSLRFPPSFLPLRIYHIKLFCFRILALVLVFHLVAGFFHEKALNPFLLYKSILPPSKYYNVK